MTGLTTVAATPRITCRECKRMLRQQHAQTSMAEKSRIADITPRRQEIEQKCRHEDGINA